MCQSNLLLTIKYVWTRLSSALLKSKIYIIIVSLLVGSLSAEITQSESKKHTLEFPGILSGLFPARFLLLNNNLFITNVHFLDEFYFETSAGKYDTNRICHVGDSPSQEADGSGVWVIKLEGLDLQASRQEVDVWLYSDSAVLSDLFAFDKLKLLAPDSSVPTRIGRAKVVHVPALNRWTGTIVCNKDEHWYDFEFYPTHDRTPDELIFHAHNPSEQVITLLNSLGGFQRQQVRRLADEIGGDEHLAASILFDSCSSGLYGVFLIGVSNICTSMRNVIRGSEAQIIGESESLCDVVEAVSPGYCKAGISERFFTHTNENRESGTPNTYVKLGAGVVTRWLLVRSPSFWETDLMISLLRIPETVSVSTFGAICGGGGFAEADVFLDSVFPSGRPSSEAMSQFLENVLNRTFAKSLGDQRFTLSIYPQSSKWLRYAVDVSGPAHLVTFTPDNYWKRLEIEIMLVNMYQGMAMLVSVPKAQRSFWDPDRPQGPPDTDYKPYDEKDGDLSRLAGTIVATANTIIDIDYARFAVQYAEQAGSWPRYLVRALQTRLKKMGYDPGQIDGLYGKNTAQGIREFQRSRNLTENGQISTSLLRTLKLSR